MAQGANFGAREPLILSITFVQLDSRNHSLTLNQIDQSHAVRILLIQSLSVEDDAANVGREPRSGEAHRAVRGPVLGIVRDLLSLAVTCTKPRTGGLSIR